MDKNTFLILIDRYLNDEASPGESRLLEEYYERMDDKGAALNFPEPDGIALKSVIMQSIKEERVIPRNTSYVTWFSIAASIFVIIGVFSFLYHRPDTAINKPAAPKSACVTVIKPGGNKARLTLSDGSVINLDDAGDGILAKQAGFTIKKDREGQLVYTATDNGNAPEKGQITYNLIETPKGGQYQIHLPDGTNVWLNSSSSLKYPAQFAGAERKVMLDGEAYFEVAKRKSQPFKVITNKEEVEVYGTHFNVNAYEDESFIRTTLLEGSVKVTRGNHSTMLKPGQQCLMDQGAFQVRMVNTNSIIDWKNGYFLFKETSIQDIMRKLSRWYDIDPEYHGKLDGLNFSGKISRSKDLSEVLKVLTLTGDVKFKVEGRRVSVMP
ncbi:FecR domain-containing protein [Pedobacter sp. PLR]|uniref:FecR domain-containing protein n=1 Tax=Pedobacter sp. PLR TaxID=2994465 RepID=UPI0022465EDA|nr:FecR domain-containing protein [Pedobacter sp. PLR]MCX2449769.1 FecR domain-containing protein [Pedobacter sp. PLR]